LIPSSFGRYFGSRWVSQVLLNFILKEGYIQSKYVHLLVITADLDNQRIHSLTHSPAPLSVINNSTNIQINEKSPSPLILIRVQGIVDLPG